jgi:hypothetical protein
MQVACLLLIEHPRQEVKTGWVASQQHVLQKAGTGT